MTDAVVVCTPAGVGKTSLVVEEIAQREGGRIEMYVPTHALAEEVAKKIRCANPKLTVKVMAGRSHPGPDGKPLCKKHQLAEEAARAGADVYGSLCARKKGGGEERCQYYATCSYIGQFTPADVTIYTHAHLPLERMRLEPGVPELAIIDESFFGACIDTIEIPLSSLHAGSLGPAAALVCAEIEHAMTQNMPLHTHLYSAGATPEVCVAALREVRQAAPTMHPSMGPKQRRAALRRLQESTQLLELLNAVCAEYGYPRPESHALKYNSEGGKITVHLKKSISRFHDRERDESRVLIIDASADRQIIGQFFDVTDFTRIPAARRAQVIQCRSTRCSKTSLVPARNSDPKSKREARKRLKEVESFIAQRAKQHHRVLVVGPQEITGNAKAKVKPLIKVPANVDLAHFGAIRGIDRWKNHDAIVVIGCNQPPIEAVEAIARCVFLHDRTPLQFAGSWTTEERGYRLKRGQAGVDVVRHPDPRVQAVLEQVREWESTQAIDRLRLVHTETPKRVYVLSNVVLDIDVDRLGTWDEMMNGGGRIEQAWNTLEGVMPLKPAWLAAKFPWLWKSVDAAKADATAVVKECEFTNIYSISNPTLFKLRYRPTPAPGRGPRQRAWSWCLSVHAGPEVTRHALEKLLGVAVEMRGPGIPAEGSHPHRRRTKSSAQSSKP